MISTDAIAAARAVRLEDETARRGIRLRGTVERSGPCPVCGGTDRFAINVRKQIFNCRGCQRGGDVVALVQHLDGCRFREAIETLISGDSIERPQVTMREHSKSADDYERKQAQKAQWLWLQRCPITNSPAERYLREARGYAGPLPATLGFLPPTKPEHRPAMISAFALVDEPEPGVLGEPCRVHSVHLTLLKPDGSGKADTTPNKLIIGSPRGLPIVLAPANDLPGLVATEGVEDSLSVHQATGLGAWAAGAAAFMPGLADVIPRYIEAVHVLVDDDPTGRREASKLIARLRARGIEVFPRLLRSREAA